MTDKQHPTNPVEDELDKAIYHLCRRIQQGKPLEMDKFKQFLLTWRSTPTPQVAVEYEEKRKELFNQVWQWFKDNRFYSNWRTEDEQDQWTAKDFQLITPENSAGSLAMEVGYLIANFMKWHKEATKRAEVEGRVDEHNLVYTKSGELDDGDFAEWSLERLKELGVDEPID